MSSNYIKRDELGAYWSDLFNALPRQTRDIAIAVEIGHNIRDLRSERARLVREIEEIDRTIERFESRLFVDFPKPPSSEDSAR